MTESRLFEIQLKKTIKRPVDEVFDRWTDPAIRNELLSAGRYKNGVKEVNPVEGGEERYEERWKNRLMGQTVRKYLTIQRPDVIIAHVVTWTPSEPVSQVFAIQETLRFLPVAQGTELAATSQISTLYPASHNAAKSNWHELFAEFEKLIA